MVCQFLFTIAIAIETSLMRYVGVYPSQYDRGTPRPPRDRIPNLDYQPGRDNGVDDVRSPSPVHSPGGGAFYVEDVSDYVVNIQPEGRVWWREPSIENAARTP